ncbi:hypothetical protein LCGC14_0495270 [marine sediment metagenome]|uniref:Uncharacterized protein n=1 Tax=marine sediment metagenome TaxID=412755 RepID=A0A0F9S5F4_9ZZZZ
MDIKNHFYIEIGNEKDLEQCLESIKEDYKTIVKDTKKYGKKKWKPEYVEKLRIYAKWKLVTWLGEEDIEKAQKKQRDEDYI